MERKKGLVSKIFTLFGYVFRTVPLDLPLALVFAAYFACVWTHRVHDTYLEPQINAMVWDSERMYAEETYYQRVCDANDQSTFDGADLFLPMNATTDDAYHHQLIHGLTVFRSVLTDKTATDLRNYIRSKNFNLPEKDSIFVIENNHRYSFGLGTEEPSVSKAVMELASHERLTPALEKILGPNPALIEMTAITATYGASDHHWHDDVIPTASALQFGRALDLPTVYSFSCKTQPWKWELPRVALVLTFVRPAVCLHSVKKMAFKLSTRKAIGGQAMPC